MPEKYYLIIDVDKCENCNNCFLACKDEFTDNRFDGYSAPQPRHGHRWIKINKKERGKFPHIDVAYQPVPCFHCEDAPCVKASKSDAVYQRSDGIVLIDPVKALGQTDILKSCPHGAIWWNEEENIAQKCTLCAHLLDEGWKEPRCVTVCPTEALQVRKLEHNQLEALIKTEKLQRYCVDQTSFPGVWYKNLHRYVDCFISGSIAANVNQVTDCVENANVVLTTESGKKINEATTDCFGDFKFDRLKADSGKYTVKISHPDYGEREVIHDLKESAFIGVIDILKEETNENTRNIKRNQER